jgi:RND family efflux transporter MFP subunit
VRVARVDTISAVEPVRATGTLVGRDELTLSFKVGGIVQRVLVDEGQPVRAGQLLATLDPVEIDAQVSRAASAAAQAERDLARLRALHRDSVITTAQLEAGTTGAEVARADLRMARFNRRFAQIVAPAAGVVLRRLVDRSEQVAAGAAALVVRGAGAGMVLRVGLPDRDAVRVRVGDAASVRFDAYPGDTFAGRVRRLAAAAAPGTGTYEAEIAIDAAGRALASGLVGRADVDVAAPRALPSVPVEALVEADGDSASVYVVRREAGGSVARRAPVRVAFVRDGRVVLASGPDVGAEVVTDGSAYVDDGAAVRVLPPAAVARPQTSLVAPAGGGRRP